MTVVTSLNFHNNTGILYISKGMAEYDDHESCTRNYTYTTEQLLVLFSKSLDHF